MEKKTVGIIVKNDNDDILYHDNSFFIKIEIDKKEDLRFTLEDKLSEILDKKAFRVDRISKKIPKLDLSNKGTDTEEIVMYLVNVYMYSDNSKFLPKKDILDNLSTSMYKDYYLKYIIRYNNYRNLVERYMPIPIFLFWILVILVIPAETRSEFILDTTFNNFWFGIIVYITLPSVILYKFIVPRILNKLVNYEVSEKNIKISKWIHFISYLVFYFALLKNIWSR